MRLLSFLFLLVVGFLAGFAAMSWYLKSYDTPWQSGVTSFRFDPADQFWNVDFGNEWQRLPDGRLWLVKPSGNLKIRLVNRPWKRVEFALMTYSARKRSDSGTVSIFVNNAPVGTLAAPKAGASAARTVVVLPQALAAKSRNLAISFRSSEPQGADNRLFALTELTLDDYFPPPMRGMVDICSRQAIRGWAATDTGGAPVVIKKNGRIVETVNEHFDRPDLPKHGLPLHAGFIYRFKTPPAKGDKFDVELPNGRHLSGKSTCKF